MRYKKVIKTNIGKIYKKEVLQNGLKSLGYAPRKMKPCYEISQDDGQTEAS